MEGPKMFAEIPADHLERVYVSERYLAGAKKGQNILPADIRYETLKDSVMDYVSDTKTPQGILAIVKMAEYGFSDLLGKDGAAHLLILENLQDPGNLGTIMRSGEGAGVTGILMSKETVDIYNPKVVRSTMGAVFRVPFLYTEDLSGAVKKLREKGVRVYAAHLRGKAAYDRVNYQTSTAFMIGNESSGLTDETAALADEYIRIPMLGQVESLNAAAAASILVFEAARQRRLS